MPPARAGRRPLLCAPPLPSALRLSLTSFARPADLTIVDIADLGTPLPSGPHYTDASLSTKRKAAESAETDSEPQIGAARERGCWWVFLCFYLSPPPFNGAVTRRVDAAPPRIASRPTHPHCVLRGIAS
ncbi:hypothetical protein C8R44DRAFT_893153 [Mycena epipterygia]|nr:hypothetical protein C8R44DRAFT_893153 [Mycena epipterygia]